MDRKLTRVCIISGALVLSVFLIIVYFPVSDREAFHSQVFPVDKGWGYEIMSNNKVIIHQKYIPAIQGSISFSSKRDANKIAHLVIRKMKADKTPFVSLQDLETNKIKIIKEK
jgi:hypothetical protein